MHRFYWFSTGPTGSPAVLELVALALLATTLLLATPTAPVWAQADPDANVTDGNGDDGDDDDEAQKRRKIVAELIAQLQEAPQPEQRQRAAYELGRMGEDAAGAVAALQACFDDPNEYVREAAIYALGEIGPVARQALLDALSHREFTVRALALTRLSRQNQIGPELIPLAKTWLDSDDLRAHDMAFHVLERSGDEAKPTLVEALVHSSLRVRERALMLLVHRRMLGSDAIPALKNWLDEPALRRQALYAFDRLDAEAKPVLVELLDHADRSVREFALDMLIRRNWLTAENIPALKKWFDDPDQRAASMDIMHALTRLGPDGRAAIVEALSHERSRIRALALDVLMLRRDWLGPDAIPHLEKMLLLDAEPNRDVAYALAQLGPDGLAVLIRGMNHDNRWIANDCWEHIQRAEHAAVAPAIAALDDPTLARIHGRLAVLVARYGEMARALPVMRALLAADFDDRDAAAAWNDMVRELDEIGLAARLPVELLASLLGHPDFDVRRMAMRMIFEMGPDAISARVAVTQLLVDLTAAPHRSETNRVEPEIRALALHWLIGISGSENIEWLPAIDVLVKMLDESHPGIAEAAIIAIARRGVAPSLVSTFAPLLVTDSAPTERHMAMHLLVTLGPVAAAQLLELSADSKWMDDEVYLLREAAVEIIDALGIEQGVPTFIEWLSHPDTDMRERAIFGLSRIAYRISNNHLLHAEWCAPVVSALTAALKSFSANGAGDDTDDYLRIQTVVTLGMFASEAALPALLDLFCEDRLDDLKELHIEIAIACIRIGPAAADGLLARLDHPDTTEAVSAHILEKLGLMRHQAAAAVPTLLNRLADDDTTDDHRLDIIWALGHIGPAAQPAVEPLIAYFRAVADDDTDAARELQRAVIGALSRIGDPIAVELLRETIHAGRDHHIAFDALARFDPLGLRTLFDWIADGRADAELRQAAALALRHSDTLLPAEWVPEIVALLVPDTSDEFSQQTALRLLDKTARSGELAEALASAPDGADLAIRIVHGALAIYERKHDPAPLSILAFIEHPPLAVLAPIIESFSRTSSPVLVELAARIGADAVPGLTAALHVLPTSRNRQRQAILALGHIGPDAASAVPAIVRVYARFRQHDTYVRRAIYFAIGAIGGESAAADAVPAFAAELAQLIAQRRDHPEQFGRDFGRTRLDELFGVLVQLGGAAKATAPLLRPLLSDHEFAQNAALILIAIGDADAEAQAAAWGIVEEVVLTRRAPRVEFIMQLGLVGNAGRPALARLDTLAVFALDRAVREAAESAASAIRAALSSDDADGGDADGGNNE